MTTVAHDVRVDESQRGVFASVSNTGTIAWASARASDHQMRWYDRKGTPLDLLPIPPGKIVQPAISPDGRTVAFTRVAGGSADVMRLDVESGTIRPVTSDPDYEESPQWSPDGRRIVYRGAAAGRISVLLATVDGATPPIPLYNRASNSSGTFAPDGKSLFVVFGDPVPKDIGIIRISKPGTIEPLVTDAFIKLQPSASPDGRWLGFTSNSSGQNEVYLAPLEDDGTTAKVGAQRVRLSAGGGAGPIWRKDGRELIYSSSDGRIMSVNLTVTGSSGVAGRPTPLFSMTDHGVSGAIAGWAANADLTKFVMVESPFGKAQRFRILTGWK